MKFFGRLKYYGIGVGMGLMLVFAMFGTRGCDWTPTNRVKSAIQSSRLAANAQMQCMLECNTISDEIIYDLIYNGKVNFKDSKTDSEPKNYILYNDEYKIGFDLNVKDSTAVVTDLYYHEEKCDCPNEMAINLIAIHKPNAIIFSELLEKGFELSEKNQCEMNCHNLSETDVRSIFEDGKIDYNQSQLKKGENPRYAITKSFNGKDFIFAIEKGYNTRLNAIKILGEEKECGC